MLLENKKKHKGVKFLKVDHQPFKNAKRFSGKMSINGPSINNHSPSNKEIRKSTKTSLNVNKFPIKIEEEKTAVHNSALIKKIFKKYSSYNKINSLKFKELLFQKKDQKKKEEEKKEKEFINKHKNKIIKLKHTKSISCKNLNLKNNFVDSKNKVINNISMINNMNKENNFRKSPLNKNKIKKEHNHPIITNNNNKNALSYDKKGNIINMKTETTNTKNEENTKCKSTSNSFKKMFCCL